jgi:hypothetical protein
MEASGQLHAPADLPPAKETPDTLWIGAWVGPRAGLNMVLKSLTLKWECENDIESSPSTNMDHVLCFVPININYKQRQTYP